jgi:hypothetical protein
MCEKSRKRRAVLASAESTIPSSFPILSAIARNAFNDVDTTYFDRHGARDEGHSGDAAMLFAISGQGTHFAAAEVEVMMVGRPRWRSASQFGSTTDRSDRALRPAPVLRELTSSHAQRA